MIGNRSNGPTNYKGEGLNTYMNMNTTKTYSHTNTFDLILSALLITLVFLATVFLNIRPPIAANGGLVHLGTAMLFIVSIVFGPKKGAIAGAFGMGLFDLISGWTLWAPFTFVTRGLQGYIVGKIAWSKEKRGSSVGFNLFATIFSIPFMLGGYYVCERVLFGNWVVPLASIPGNVVQNVVGILVAIPVCLMLKKFRFFK